MMARRLRVVILLGLAAIAGCATTPIPGARPAAIEDRQPEEATLELDVLPDVSNGLSPTMRDITPDSGPHAMRQPDLGPPVLESAYPAVYALVENVERLSQQGNDALAVANLERALRIEPSNPWLWYRLAGLHFKRGDFLQARATAQRSISLAGGAPRIHEANRVLLERIAALEGNGKRRE